MNPMVSFNQEWVRRLSGLLNTPPFKRARARLQQQIREDGAYAINMLPFPLIFPREHYDELVTAGRHIIDAQTLILEHMLAHHSRPALLQAFGLPAALEPFIDWEELRANTCGMARFDLVPSADGFQMCELNYGSPVGGMEEFDGYAAYAAELDMPLLGRARAPRRQTAASIAAAVQRHGAQRVVLLVASANRDLGYFSLSFLQRHVEHECPGLQVDIADEFSYPADLLQPGQGNKVVVYRMFVVDDILANTGFYQRLFASGAAIVNGMDAEVRMSKRWFCLMHDADLRSLLLPEQRAAIDRCIPLTRELGPGNLQALLEDKDRLVFKTLNSFGGKGVVLGREIDTPALRQLLESADGSAWCAQALVESEGMPLPTPGVRQAPVHRLVLGLYFHGSAAAGMNVRASATSMVVNVSSGRARSGWAVPLSTQEAGRVLARLAACECPPAALTTECVNLEQ